MPITINGSTGIAGVDGSASTPAIQGTDTNTGVTFPAADTVAVSTGGSERMRVDSSGNVGIGTASPAYQLDCTSTIRGRGDAYFGFVSGSQAGVWWSQSNYSAPAFQGLTSAGGLNNLYLQPGGGNVYLGLQASDGFAGGLSSQFLTIGAGSGTSNRMSIGNGTSTSGYSVHFYPTDGGVYFSNNSSVRDYTFLKNSGGSYATVTAVINNVSDYRLKENVVDMDGALDKLSRVRPVRYNFKDDIPVKMPWGESTVDGFIAHELQEVMPEAVYGEKDAVYDDGKLKPQQVDMTRLIPALVGAVQELSAKVDALQTEINALKGAA